MKPKIRVILMVAATALILFALMVFDYSRLNQSKNWSLLLTIASMIFFLSSMIIQIRHDKKNQQP